MPQFPHVKWWNGISEKLGKAQRKTLLKRKVLQPASMICPHAPWKNTALQLQRKALFSHVAGKIPKQLRPQPSYCSYQSHGLWISSSPLKIPNPDSLSLDNRPGKRIRAHFCPMQQELLTLLSLTSSRICRGENMIERKERTEASGKLGGIWRGSGSGPCGCQ